MEKWGAITKILVEQFPSAKILVWELEMLSYESVMAFAERCSTLERIDFAILGTGGLPSEFRLNPLTGYEMTIQIHY
jgi:hypothetical protein